MQKNNPTVKAINKNIRCSPRKLSLVCNFIKGKKADLALRDLEFSRKRISKDVSKTVKSAIANAENNHDLDIEELIVSEAFVGKNLGNKTENGGREGAASRTGGILCEDRCKSETSKQGSCDTCNLS